MRIALYPGSFDPMTNGHLDILSGALRISDHVVIAIGVHPEKKSLFTFDERVALIESVAKDSLGADAKRIEVRSFHGLLVEVAKSVKATVLVRGVRDGTDLDYEMQMAGMNGAMAADLQTVFLPATPIARPITATLVRQIAAMGGDVSAFVPATVAKALKSKFKSK
ncbi:MAG: pantetheine-phosphate adenylyltransferase [Rhizobiaceae bacterium]